MREWICPAWIRGLRSLPASTRGRVWEEMRQAERAGERWTRLRKLKKGEPPWIENVCCGEQPCDAKGKMPRCQERPVTIRYAVGGIEQGMEQIFCAACALALLRRAKEEGDE